MKLTKRKGKAGSSEIKIQKNCPKRTFWDIFTYLMYCRNIVNYMKFCPNPMGLTTIPGCNPEAIIPGCMPPIPPTPAICRVD